MSFVCRVHAGGAAMVQVKKCILAPCPSQTLGIVRLGPNPPPPVLRRPWVHACMIHFQNILIVHQQWQLSTTKIVLWLYYSWTHDIVISSSYDWLSDNKFSWFAPCTQCNQLWSIITRLHQLRENRLKRKDSETKNLWFHTNKTPLHYYHKFSMICCVAVDCVAVELNGSIESAGIVAVALKIYCWRIKILLQKKQKYIFVFTY